MIEKNRRKQYVHYTEGSLEKRDMYITENTGTLLWFPDCFETFPVGPVDGYILGNVQTLNSKLAVRCYDGVVESGDPSIVCLSTGRWSGNTATCVRGTVYIYK